MDHVAYTDVSVVGFRTNDGALVFAWAPSDTVNEESFDLPKLYTLNGTKVNGKVYFTTQEVFDPSDHRYNLASPYIPYYLVGMADSRVAQHVLDDPSFLSSHLEFYNGLKTTIQDTEVSITSSDKSFCPNCFFGTNPVPNEENTFSCAYCNTTFKVVDTSSDLAGINYQLDIISSPKEETVDTPVEDTTDEDLSDDVKAHLEYFDSLVEKDKKEKEEVITTEEIDGEIDTALEAEEDEELSEDDVVDEIEGEAEIVDTGEVIDEVIDDIFIEREITFDNKDAFDKFIRYVIKESISSTQSIDNTIANYSLNFISNLNRPVENNDLTLIVDNLTAAKETISGAISTINRLRSILLAKGDIK